MRKGILRVAVLAAMLAASGCGGVVVLRSLSLALQPAPFYQGGYHFPPVYQRVCYDQWRRPCPCPPMRW